MTFFFEFFENFPFFWNFFLQFFGRMKFRNMRKSKTTRDLCGIENMGSKDHFSERIRSEVDLGKKLGPLTLW